jgi:hypothetical protein
MQIGTGELKHNLHMCVYNLAITFSASLCRHRATDKYMDMWTHSQRHQHR